MYKFKLTTGAFEHYSAETFKTKAAVEKAALHIAEKACASLNIEGNEKGDYFEVMEYAEIFSADGNTYSCHPVAVIWLDKAPDDRENDCQLKVVSGFDFIEVTEEWAKEVSAEYTNKLRERFGKDLTIEIVGSIDEVDGIPRWSWIDGRTHGCTYFEDLKDAYKSAVHHLTDSNFLI
jgi:hypothetical protein